jgi:hypothetical protein
MSICKIETIQKLRNDRYMLTTSDGEILTTTEQPTGVVGVRAAIAAMTGPFWATIELDAAGHLTTLEGVEF